MITKEEIMRHKTIVKALKINTENMKVGLNKYKGFKIFSIINHKTIEDIKWN